MRTSDSMAPSEPRPSRPVKDSQHPHGSEAGKRGTCHLLGHFSFSRRPRGSGDREELSPILSSYWPLHEVPEGKGYFSHYGSKPTQRASVHKERRGIIAESTVLGICSLDSQL